MSSRSQNAVLRDVSDQLDQATLEIAERIDAPVLTGGSLKQAPDTIEELLQLAGDADLPEEQIRMLREAVRHGERMWEATITREPVKFTWNDLGCRAYLRALHGLMYVLDEIGEVGEATIIAQKLLALDATDNLHARYQAVLGNIELGNWASAERILRQYRHDIGTSLSYSRLLICRHNQGNAAPLLKAAVASNIHVASMIDQRVPKPNGVKIMPGSKEEASAYVFAAAGGWRRVNGAIPWLKSIA